MDRLLVEYPDPPPLARGAAVEAVAWVLQRPLFTPIVEKTAAVASATMTSSAQDLVGIDLADVVSQAGSTVVGVISGIDPEAGTQAQASLDAALAGAVRECLKSRGRFSL